MPAMRAGMWPKRRGGGRRAAPPWRAALAVAILPTLIDVSAALAEQQTTPPDPEKPLWQWLILVGFIALCCAVAFKNPKRSHMS